MDPLDEFSQRVSARLAEARKVGVQMCETAQYMAQFEPKYRQFEQIATRLVAEVIQPRLETVARFFPNSKVRRAPHENQCVGWFGYCERFPNCVKLELTIDADERLEHVICRYDLHIIPAFMKYDSHDKLSQPLAHVDDGQVAAWVEDRLLGFVDTYLSLDRGDAEAEEHYATDPVCGMRVDVARALQSDYRGHTYYFCAEACRQCFSATPERYIVFEME